MKLGRVMFFLGLATIILSTSQVFAASKYGPQRENPYFATDSRYDYLYANPPKQSLGAYGRYIFTNSKVRYVHSPSRLKGTRHAARINANNLQAYGY